MISYQITELPGFENNTSLYIVQVLKNGVVKSYFRGSGAAGKPSIMYKAIKIIWKRLK